MNLETRKITFIQEFLKLQNEAIIIDLEAFLQKRRIELLESELKPMSEMQFYSAIDQSVNDIENGKITEASVLKNKIKNW